MKIIIPKDVEEIIETLYKHDKEAFIVGGCVRDSIIGLNPNDYDVTTNAKPEEVLDIFKNYKVIETGIDHGTVSIIKNNEVYEITTYRIDGEYNDNRRPDYVEFTKDITKDLQRRDFTINAMAYNDKIGLVDEFEGIGDIDKKLIKTVGDADERFEEDSLRIIRAVRFSAKLGFDVENKTMNSIYKNMHLIKNVSVERIQQELNKILTSDNPEKIYMLYDAGMFDYLGVNKISLSKEDLYKLKYSNKDINIRLTILIYLMKNNEESIKILDILKYSNKIKNKCKILLDNIDNNIKDENLNIKIYMNKIGKDNLKEVLHIKNICDRNTDKYRLNKKIIKIIDNIEKNNECYTLKELQLKGSDLQKFGYKGNEIGKKLNEMLYKVMENPKLNDKNKLIKLLKTV